MIVTKIRMLRLISGNTRKYIIQNKKIYIKFWVTPIDEKIMESLFRWFGHMQRRVINTSVGKS